MSLDDKAQILIKTYYLMTLTFSNKIQTTKQKKFI